MFSKKAFLRHLSKKSIATLSVGCLLPLSQAQANSKPTISGISSGGFMSVQMATIYSSQFSGVGTIAGGFFYCSQNHLQEKIKEGQSHLFVGSRNLLQFEPSDKLYTDVTTLMSPEKWFKPAQSNPIYQAVGVCMADPKQAALPDLKQMATENKIDSVDHFKNLKAYIYQGKKDSVVNPEMVDQLTSFYTTNGIQQKQIQTTYGSGGHNFPTDKEGLNPCEAQDVPYISSCQLDVAQQVLTHLTGQTLQKSKPQMEHLYLVDQTLDHKNQVVQSQNENTWKQPTQSLAPYGYLYAPEQCLKNPSSCAVHVALHGCKMSDSFSKDFDESYQNQVAGTQILEMRSEKDLNLFNSFLPTIEQKKNQYGTLKFAVNSGYIDYAEKNNLMILFPQTWITEANFPYNPKGCWDWFGWTGSNYASKKGAEASWMMSFIQAVSVNPKSFILQAQPHWEALNQK